MAPQNRDESFVLAAVLLFSAGIDIAVMPAASTLCVAMTLAATALVVRPLGASAPRGLRTPFLVICTALAMLPWGFTFHDVRWPGLIALVVVAGFTKSALVRWASVALAGAIVGLAIVQSFHWGYVGIDVFPIFQQGSDDILHGRDPYRRTFQVLATSSAPTLNEYVSVPAGYGPAVFLLLAPLRPFGDVRLTLALALLATSVCVAIAARRRQIARRQIATLLLLLLASPITTVMLLYGWGEPLALLPLMLWWRKRDESPLWGLLFIPVLCGKVTTLPLILPLILCERRYWKAFGVGIIGSFLLLIPFALDVGPTTLFTDLTSSLVGGAIVKGPERQSVTFDAVLLQFNASPIPRTLAAALALICCAALIWRTRRTNSDIARAARGVPVLGLLMWFAPIGEINYLWPPAVWLLWLAFQPDRGEPVDGSTGRHGRIGVQDVTSGHERNRRRRWSPT